MEAGADRDVAQQMIGRRGEIRYRDRLAGGRGLAEHAIGLVDHEMRAFGIAVDAVRLGQVELMPCRVVAVDQDRVGLGDFQRARRHRRQHGVEIERGGHRAADFLQHLELVDRARQIARALLDLGLQDRIGLVQLAGHAVELVGEFFQLVLGMHVDTMAEIAGPQPPRPGAQRIDRDQHPPRQQHAGRGRDRKPEPDQQRDPHQLIPDRRQRLRGRLLEQHEPAELRNAHWPPS